MERKQGIDIVDIECPHCGKHPTRLILTVVEDDAVLRVEQYCTDYNIVISRLEGAEAAGLVNQLNQVAEQDGYEC